MEYEVTLRFQYPAWDERDGIRFYIQANSKSEAIKWARKEAERDWILPSSGKGRASFKAEIPA